MSKIKAVQDKERVFVLEYMAGNKPAEAARKAGYKGKNLAMQANRIMNRPRVKQMIQDIRDKDNEEFEIKRHEILWNLWACATRDGKDFVNEDGTLILVNQNLNDLPDRVTAAIDSIKQKERRWLDKETGNVINETVTELKLVSKAAALDMAMKHKGLFSQDVSNNTVVLDFSGLYNGSSNGNGHAIDVDPIEERLLEEEKKHVKKARRR